MIAPDINVLVYAAWNEATDHAAYSAWLETVRQQTRPLILFEPVLAGFFRVLTHRRIITHPFTFAEVEKWVNTLLETDTVTFARAGERHWHIFSTLCRTTRATGNFIPDAYLAALAIERGCEWITADRGFARFPALKWRHPLTQKRIAQSRWSRAHLFLNLCKSAKSVVILY